MDQECLVLSVLPNPHLPQRTRVERGRSDSPDWNTGSGRGSSKAPLNRMDGQFSFIKAVWMISVSVLGSSSVLDGTI